ncbi:hypothetical protein BC829DRAFT_490035 [Chytridium lagenaria]|nr:hypothetical protein BC829DRAFT_490035 [Chytridium lagenaria]
MNNVILLLTTASISTAFPIPKGGGAPPPPPKPPSPPPKPPTPKPPSPKPPSSGKPGVIVVVPANTNKETIDDGVDHHFNADEARIVGIVIACIIGLVIVFGVGYFIYDHIRSWYRRFRARQRQRQNVVDLKSTGADTGGWLLCGKNVE